VSDKAFNVPPANKNVPPINDPVADVYSLVDVTKRLKQGVDSLAGYRGGTQNRAVTFDDLVSIGVLPAHTFNTATGGAGNTPGGFASQADLFGESQARKVADDTEAAARAAADDAEETARIAADAAEAAARTAADTALQDNIDDEETARIAADTAEATTRAADDNAEETARIAADANLQNQITADAVPVVTFAGLPATPGIGKRSVVTDATVNTWNATISVGGGALKVLVWWNGTAWKVIGA